MSAFTKRFDDIPEPVRGMMIKAVEETMERSLDDTANSIVVESRLVEWRKLVVHLVREVDVAERVMGIDVEEYVKFVDRLMSEMSRLERIWVSVEAKRRHCRCLHCVEEGDEAIRDMFDDNDDVISLSQ